MADAIGLSPYLIAVIVVVGVLSLLADYFGWFEGDD
tara:strand:+ start:159 stop:266 length:108 start_codon:yes stop_codon:yes gene_type:complete